MKELRSKLKSREHRARRVRTKLRAVSQYPRLSVFRSLKHLSAQIVDDQKQTTLVSACDREVSGQKGLDRARAVGKLLAGKALKRKITTVAFDRGAYTYHGKVKALAEGARAGGLKF
jgi:large subunit ribosomal protein L18